MVTKKQLLDYLAFTRSTVVYPKEVELAYLTLGLINELDEYSSAISSEGNSEQEIKEAGDVMWYTARLADATDTIDDFICMFLGAAFLGNQYSTFLYKDGIAELAGRVKKVLRGDENAVVKIAPTMIDVYDTVIKRLKTDDFGEYLHKVLTVNQLKLETRKEDGKLKGDGDER